MKIFNLPFSSETCCNFFEEVSKNRLPMERGPLPFFLLELLISWRQTSIRCVMASFCKSLFYGWVVTLWKIDIDVDFYELLFLFHAYLSLVGCMNGIVCPTRFTTNFKCIGHKPMLKQVFNEKGGFIYSISLGIL